MRSSLSHTSQAYQVIERQMRNWELARRVQEPAVEAAPPVRCAPPALHPYVAVSRMVGSGGGQVGRAIAARLGWSFFDRELLDIMSCDDDIRRRVYALEDEHQRGLIESVLLTLGDERQDRREDYFHRLTQATVMILSRQPAVLVGRGVGFLLPAAMGINLRVVAAEEYCVARFAVRRNLPMETARKERRQLEQDRMHFLSTHFGPRSIDSSAYDLVVAADRLSQSEAVDLVVALAQSRFRHYFARAAEAAEAVTPPPVKAAG